MATKAYKTQTGTPYKAIAELLIASFSSQLKGWWDYHLTKAEHLQILNDIMLKGEIGKNINLKNNKKQLIKKLKITRVSLKFLKKSYKK